MHTSSTHHRRDLQGAGQGSCTSVANQILVEVELGDCAIYLVILHFVKPARKSRHHCPLGCFSSAVARVFPLAQWYLFFKVLAADQRDARYAFAQPVMASSLLIPCAPWPVEFLGGAHSKSEVRALKLPLAFGMNVTRRCFSASVAHAFSAGKTKSLEGCLIVP